LEDLQHEPRSALTPEGDGLNAIRALLRGAPSGLRPGAWMLIEHGWDQGAASRALMDEAGFQAVQTRRDWGGRERCTGGCWPT
jgi:release factor glutamine methyltransferase